MSGNASSCFDRTWMKWMFRPLDLGHELRQGIQPRLALPPVGPRRPVAREFLNGRRLYALRLISDSLLADEARRLDPSAKVVQLLVRHVDLEGRISNAVSTVVLTTTSLLTQ